MARPTSSRLGNLNALARLVRSLPAAATDPVERRRRMVAEFCQILGADYSQPVSGSIPGLPPRHQQTLEGLLAGDSEKQIAQNLKVSRNTVHVYVTALYRRFGVNSRGELLARFVKNRRGRPPSAADSDPLVTLR